MNKPKLIILEGPDGAGKTTLAKELGKLTKGLVIAHGAEPQRKEMFPYFVQSLKIAAESKRTVIFDRCWLSEPIYGAALRKGKDRVGVHRRALDRVALGMNAVMVQCWPSKETVLHNWAATRENQLPQDEEKMERIYDAYCSAFMHPSLPAIPYDYTRASQSAEWVADQVAQLFANEVTRNAGPGIGAWVSDPLSNECSPITLIIGEQPGEKDPHRIRHLDWPFVSDQGCSAWLSGELDRVGASELRLYWVNALRANGKWESPKFITALKPRRVVAMGEKARTWCLLNGIVHYHISHPQFWKRFHSKKRWFELDALFGDVKEQTRST